MYSHVNSNLELRADAVRAADEDRVLVSRGLEIERAAETANLAIGPGSSRGTHERLDYFHEGVAGIDRDTCL
jgi:hypothetical protein